ncbi:Microtubule bundling protein [Knufia obscura]|uniref:Microtubule bundling protein n=2 Tax=Knufia TaxID=430999 RepID=A0AAN8I2I3_9EURO|nr:Microtubule bundling protein [Knufia obscura]KAK5951302.1 Microtubule bundling protein [Knufia fluminis]
MPGAMDTSFLQNQVTTIIGQLHSIFDEIGVPRNERESRETELFTALSETLNNQLRLANGEKTQLTEEAQNIINTIKQMEKSLEDDKDYGYNLNTRDMKVTYPLVDCLRDLKEKYNTVSRLHRERFEQVKKLVQALESYSSHLESSFIKIKLPPTNSNSCPPTFDLSPSYVAKLDEEFTRVYDEYNKRVNVVQTTSEEIVRLWSDLGIPQAQTDSTIVQNYRESPEQLGLHQSDMDRLKGRRDKLVEEKRSREKRLKDIKATIENLWDRLGVQEPDRKAFLAANRGCGLRTINEYEDELARLNELKRQNLHLFVEDARVRIQELWDALYFSEEEMLDFTPAFSDVYSDALLSAHEAEIERLLTLKDQRAPILAQIEKHRSLISDRDALSASAADASRLLLKPQKGEKRDPGKLLREEKMRKRIAKELPKVAADLAKTLQKYEDEYGRPFLVHGESYLEELEALEVKAPPPRSKTPNGLPPRSKTPAPAPAAKPAPAKSIQPPRPKSAIGNSSVSRPGARTPASTRPAIARNPPSSTTQTSQSSQPPSRIPQSPSKLPARVPLGNMQHGGNSPERRRAAPHQLTQSCDTSMLQHSFAQSTRSMGPPRAPPPRMRNMYEPPAEQTPATMAPYSVSNRPPSALSSSTSEASSKFVRPVSPEDVYDDRERMSYMSASLIDREKHYHQNMSYQSSVQQNPPREASRQTSNTSSNLTTGTTASGSENWETYSDASEREAEREPRDGYHSKVYGKRAGGPYGHMAPPPKMRVQERIDERDENAMRVNGSDAAWSECSETF